MNEFSPKAETNDMELPRTMERFALLLVSSPHRRVFLRHRRHGGSPRHVPRFWFKTLNLNKSEIARCRSRWNNLLCKLWNLMLRIKWNEINPSPPQRFHTPQAYFTPVGHFTNPERDLFRWKKHAVLCKRLWASTISKNRFTCAFINIILWNIPLTRDVKCLPYGKREILLLRRNVK